MSDPLDIFRMDVRFAGEKLAVAIQARADSLKTQIMAHTTPEMLQRAIDREMESITQTVVRSYIQEVLRSKQKEIKDAIFASDDFDEMLSKAVRDQILKEIKS